MLYRTMPANGDKLSILGFGCMRLPMKDGAIDEERAIAQLRYAIDNGVNYLDTAWPYHGGASEPLVGRALKDGYREKVKLATKLPSWLIEKPSDMDRFLDAQLEKLGTDHIDYYLVHSLNSNLWENVEKNGVKDFLDRAQADGRIINPGFSYHGLAQDFTRIVDAYPWVFCQIQFNYLDRDYQAGEAGLKYAHEKGLGIIIMEPLRGGYLGMPDPAKEIADIWNSAKVKRSPVEWALRWIWNYPEPTVIISGMNEEEHIKENIAAASDAEAGVFTKEELQVVDRVADKFTELLKVNCTGCGYCMPCPADVRIPYCFDAYNKMFLDDPARARFTYAAALNIMASGKTGYASQCVSCGECVDKCPQNIQIPEVLKEVAEAFEGPGFEEAVDGIVKMMTNIK